MATNYKDREDIVFTDRATVFWNKGDGVASVEVEVEDFSRSFDEVQKDLGTLSLIVYPDELYIYLGDILQYRALLSLPGGFYRDVTDITDWYFGEGSTGIAEFDKDKKGLLYTRKVGEDIVYANYGGMFITPAPLYIHQPLVVPQLRDIGDAYNPTTRHYRDLITSQYQNSPKFLAWLESYLEIVEDIREMAQSLIYYFSFNPIISPDSPEYIDDAFTVKKGKSEFAFETFDVAEGKQLDMLGAIIGQPRRLYFKANNVISPPTPAQWHTLSDSDYRTLLKNKMMVNTWDGKAATLQAAWEVLYPGGKITMQDNQNMTVDVTITGALSAVIINLIVNGYIIPRPQGVWFNYYYGLQPFFGFDRDDDYIAGFDEGHWV